MEIEDFFTTERRLGVASYSTSSCFLHLFSAQFSTHPFTVTELPSQHSHPPRQRIQMFSVASAVLALAPLAVLAAPYDHAVQTSDLMSSTGT